MAYFCNNHKISRDDLLVLLDLVVLKSHLGTRLEKSLWQSAAVVPLSCCEEAAVF